MKWNTTNYIYNTRRQKMKTLQHYTNLYDICQKKKIIKNLLFHMPSVYEAIQILCNYMKGPRSEMYHSLWWHRDMWVEADVVSRGSSRNSLCNYLKGPRSEMYHSSWWHRDMWVEADVVSRGSSRNSLCW